MRGWPIVVIVGLTVGLVGPRVVGPSSRPATEPFAYVPPEGFVPTSTTSEKADAARARAWELPSDEGVRAVVVVHHSALAMQVDEPSLGTMAASMPEAFEDCTWIHRRHEMRIRTDGARIGLIEGDCGRSRKMQLVLPENDGTSIATISYPAEQAARWEPVFEATIDAARGVATRVPPPPLAHHLAWGAAGLVLASLFAALFRKR